MVSTHLNSERLLQIKHFLQNNQGVLSREALTSVIKRIIIGPGGVVTFITSKTDCSLDGFISVNDLVPILSGYDLKTNWQLIELGV